MARKLSKSMQRKAAVLDTINTIANWNMMRKTPAEAYMTDYLTQYEEDHCQQVVARFRRFDTSMEYAIRTLFVFDRKDGVRRRMIGSEYIEKDHVHGATLYAVQRRRMCQRWYRETHEGRAKHVSALYELISMDPGAFLTMVQKEPPKSLWRKLF